MSSEEISPQVWIFGHLFHVEFVSENACYQRKTRGAGNLRRVFRFPWGIFQLSIDRFPALKKDKTAFCPRVTAEGRPREFKEFEI